MVRVQHKRKGEGVEGHFGGCVEGWRRHILLTSPSFPDSSWLFPALLGLLFTLCHFFWTLGMPLAIATLVSVVIMAHTTREWPHTSHHAQIALQFPHSSRPS